MYEAILSAHNWVRWPIILAGLFALHVTYHSYGTATFSRQVRRAGSIFVGLLDLQLLIGIVLAFVSPIVKLGMQDMAETMSNRASRFITLEHEVLLVLAIIFGHIGSARIKRIQLDSYVRRQSFLWYGLALLLVLIAIPWSRPLFRLG